ncbi:MAG: hypothetical protein WKF62_00495 [Solirubrobacterales bacterium]
MAVDAERWQITEHESAVACLAEELRTEMRAEMARAEATLRQRLEAAAEHRHGDLAEKLSAELAGAVRREMETVAGSLRSEAVARAAEIETNLTAKATAFESALGTQIEASITSWKFGAREEVLHSVRAEAIDLLEERLAAAASNLAAANAAAVELELSVARSKLSRQVKKRNSKATGKLEAALEARLVRAEKTLKRRTSLEIEAAKTSVRDTLDAELARVRAQIKAGVDEATAVVHERIVAMASDEFTTRSAHAVEALRSRNEVARLETTSELKKAHDEATAATLVKLHDRALVTADALEERISAHVAAGLGEAQELLIARTDESRTEISRSAEARFAEGLRAVTQRISGEVRSELTQGLATVERRLDEQADSVLAEHASALEVRADERAREAVSSAAERASHVAAIESRRRFSELEPRLHARIEQAERSASEAAEARLEEALEKVRAESAERLGEERTAFRSSTEATREALEKAIAELGRRKIRQEAKLARVETSRRITLALEKLEVRATSLIGELDARLERSSQEIKATVAVAEAAAAETRADARTAAEQRLAEAASEIRAAKRETGERLGDALRRVEDTVATVEASRGRVAELERRAKAAEAEATRSAEMARNAVVLETRMREALNLEAAAAEQIALAERRLIDFVERA